MANDVNAIEKNKSSVVDGKRKAKKELDKIRDEYFGSDDDDDLDFGKHRQKKQQESEIEADLIGFEQFKGIFRSLRLKIDPEGRTD